ncbi:MAG: Ig domain-containing protein [Clostridia bacterium]|nr:Ig domain-containing protein [Clostridia bacterium]
MKRLSKLFVFVLAFVMALSTLVACQSEQPGGGGTPPPEANVGVTLDRTSASVDIYETLTLTATKENLTGEIVWTSSDESKATVSGGVVTPVSEGKTTVTASVGGKSASCVVTVINSGQVPTLSLETGDETVRKGDEIVIGATFNYKGVPVNATFDYIVEKDDVVSVENGKIKAIGTGKSKVTVSATYKGFTAYKVINVTVTANVVFYLNETSVDLGLSALAGMVTNKTVTANVQKDNEKITSPVIAWATDNANIANVENGVITAVGVGETIISATYATDGESFTINLPVTVKKPVVDAPFTVPAIDLNGTSGTTISLDLTSSLEGTGVSASDIVKIVDLTDDNYEVPFTVNGENIVIEKTKLAAGEKSLNLEFNVVSYNIEMIVATKIITTASHIDNMKTYALTDKNTKVVWDRSEHSAADITAASVSANVSKVYQFHGYFLLGNDIAYNKAVPDWCGRMSNGNTDKELPGTSISPNKGDIAGFHGTVNGNGHAIIGLTPSVANGGFVGTLGTGGVIKNIAFINAKSIANSAVVASLNFGTMENVYVQGSIVTSNAGWGIHGIVATKGANPVYKNVIADVTNPADSTTSALFAGWENNGTFANCHAIGEGASIRTLSSQSNPVDVFANYAALAKSNSFTLSAWDEKYWDTTSGVPVFKAYLNYVDKGASSFVGVNDKYVLAKGESASYTIATTPAKFSVVSIKEDIEGVSYDNGKLIVASTVTEPVTVTLQTYSIFSIDEVTEKQIRILPMSIVDLRGEPVAQYDMGGNEPFVLNLDQIDGKEVTDIAVNGVGFDFTQAGTTLTFDQAGYKATKQHGVVELTVSGEDFSYRLNVLNVSKIITTADELLNLKSYAPNKKTYSWELWGGTASEENYDGYFILGANIDLGDSKVKNVKSVVRIWYDVEASAGFSGVFDGQGYTINGGVYGQGGLFGYLWKTGVVKNVAFVNAKISAEAFSNIIGVSLWGRLENVLFHVVESKMPECEGAFVAMNVGSTAVCKNVVLYEYTDLNKTNAGRLSAFINHKSLSGATYENTFVFTDSYVGQQRATSNEFTGILEPNAITETLDDVGIDGKGWSNVWDMTGDRAIFASQKQAVLDALGDIEMIELTVGKEYVFPEIDGYGFNVTTTADSSVATVDGKVLKIANTLSQSTTFTVTITWEANANVKKDVTVKAIVTTKHDFTANPVDVELSDGNATFAVTIAGLSEQIKKVTVNDVEVAYTASGETVTVNKSTLTAGDRTLIVLTEANEYIYSLEVLNKVIKTKQEFINFIESASYVSGDKTAGFTGYVALGANIDLENRSINPAMGQWSSGWIGGWRGVFDGRGYTLSNYKIDGQDKGLFRMMYAEGVFKNTVIKNVTVNGSSGAITCANSGTIENVIVIGKITGGDGNPNVGAGLFASNSNNSTTTKYINCVGILTEFGQTLNHSLAGIITSTKYNNANLNTGATFTNVIAINAMSGNVVLPFAAKHTGRVNGGTTPAIDPVSNYQGANLYANDTATAKTFANMADYTAWAATASGDWATAIELVSAYNA